MKRNFKQYVYLSLDGNLAILTKGEYYTDLQVSSRYIDLYLNDEKILLSTWEFLGEL